MAHQTTHIQTELTRLASLKTQRLEHEARPTIPNLTGIRRRVS